MHNQSDNLDVATEYTQAVTDAIVAKHAQAMREAESRPSLTECQECDESIPEARQRAVKGVQLCVPCAELAALRLSGVPRRG
ncbi:TraR/DksA C4-type zinc finger protein [Pseudomonas paeninsulae]|uniref:TraR/DksA C4-type zinc finger protein n=1 Tax=Pseudomonas paeninsulae TaxID=3110772 RepID=UPI002D791B37|nr:TraR/DksA C4-type zinc finger protein [Pseudomonas sp. IT1137]